MHQLVAFLHVLSLLCTPVLEPDLHLTLRKAQALSKLRLPPGDGLDMLNSSYIANFSPTYQARTKLENAPVKFFDRWIFRQVTTH